LARATWAPYPSISICAALGLPFEEVLNALDGCDAVVEHDPRE
jgi:hypothetical protein